MRLPRLHESRQLLERRAHRGLAALNDDYLRYLAIGQRIREEAERALAYSLGEAR